MARQLFNLFLFAVLLASCDNRKSYKYIEVVEEENVFGKLERKEKDAKTILASNDSVAYLEAFEDFCISMKVNKDMKQSLGKVYSTPIEFRLLNDKSEDIGKTILFAGKDEREKEIAEKVFSLKNSMQEAVDKNKVETKIDSVKVKDLEKYFRQRKDEFSNDNRIWYEPKTAPQYTNRNGIYCYFQTANGVPSNLRFRLQYYADEWLFFSRVQFSIDGKAYEYIPSGTETDHGNGGYIWEWFDESLTQSDKELIYALANAKSAKMKLIGKQYHDIKTLTQEQINSIKHTLDLYNAMGGQY